MENSSFGRPTSSGSAESSADSFETHWKGLLAPSWERELDLQHSHKHILLYWSGTPDQRRTENSLYRRASLQARAQKRRGA